MIENIISNLTPLLEEYAILISFLGGFFGGEETGIILVLLSFQSFMSFWTVFIFFQLGTVISDSLIFFLARSKLASKLKKSKIISSGYDKVSEFIEEWTHDRLFLSFILAKFLYGTRIVMVAYLSREDINYKKFLIYDIVGTLSLMVVISVIGWFVSLGYDIILDIFKNVQIAISFIIAFFILFYIMQKAVNKFIIKKEKEEEKEN